MEPHTLPASDTKVSSSLVSLSLSVSSSSDGGQGDGDNEPLPLLSVLFLAGKSLLFSKGGLRGYHHLLRSDKNLGELKSKATVRNAATGPALEHGMALVIRFRRCVFFFIHFFCSFTFFFFLLARALPE